MSTTPPPIPQLPSEQTYNQRLLAQIRALLLGKALDDVSEYEIAGRRLTKIPLLELRRWEAEIETRVLNEHRRRKGLPQRYIPIVFGQEDTGGGR